MKVVISFQHLRWEAHCLEGTMGFGFWRRREVESDAMQIHCFSNLTHVEKKYGTRFFFRPPAWARVFTLQGNNHPAPPKAIRRPKPA